MLAMCSLCASAQQSLVFEPAEWDFGSVRESDGPVSHTFTAHNRSDRPLVILRVVSTCGCTVPEYSREPILPGRSATVRITFDPTGRPGAFDRELAVFDSDRRKVATLRIRGTVEERPKSLGELYPIEAGALRLERNLCPFGNLCHGRTAEITVGVANPTHRAVRLELIPLRESGLLETEAPAEIGPDDRSEIRLRYTLPEESERYGTIEDLFALRVDGHETPVRLLAHGIAVDNPDRPDEALGAKAVLDRATLRFGVLKRGATPRRCAFRLANDGAGPLVVRAVETEGTVVCSLRPGDTVASGDALNAFAELNPAETEYGFVSGRITLVTNDPSRPVRRLRFTAVVEE